MAMTHVTLEEWWKEILEVYVWQIMFGRIMNEKIRKNPLPISFYVI